MNKIFFVHYNRILKLILPLIISAAFFVSKAIPCHADGTMLSDFSAELLFQQDFHSPNAIIQSVCVDENYIYTIENVADDPSPGYNFQAFCIADGYILQSPLTMYLTESNYLMAYSVSDRDVVDCVTVDFGLQDFVKREPEQIARFDDTSFIVAMNGTREDGSGTVFFYKITFPYFQPSDSLFASDDSSAQIQPEQTAVVQPSSKTANSEVKITRLQDLIVGKSSRELNKKQESSALTYIIPVIAAAVFAWYINIVRIKRKRKRKDEHIRQLRTKLQMRIERELKESLSNEDWYDDF